MGCLKDPVVTTGKKKLITSREWFALLMGLSYMLGLFFKQFSIFYYQPFMLMAFCGSAALLVDYGLQIRKHIFFPIPLMLACEIAGDLSRGMGFPLALKVAVVLYAMGALLYPVGGLLMIIQGIRLGGQYPDFRWKLPILGVLAAGLGYYEYATYYPDVYNLTAPVFKFNFLFLLFWLLFIDFSTPFHKRPELKIERQVLHYATFVVALTYFIRVIFK